MSFPIFFVLLVVFATTAFAQKGSPCITPNGEKATCVPAVSCHVIVSALLSGNKKVKEFAKQSQCGFNGHPLVCCGSTANPTFSPPLHASTEKSQITTDISTTEKEKVILVNFHTKKLPDRTSCGLGSKETRIIGGEVTDLDEFPWMAALEYENTKSNGENAGIRCGGTVISNWYILTAAHCIVHKELKISSVRLGEWKLSTDPDCQQVSINKECADEVQNFKVAIEIPHPYYSAKTGDNDIGLLKVDNEIEYSDYIRPICMPPPNLPSPKLGTDLTVAGWGATGHNSTSSDVKLKVAVPLVLNDKCIEKIEKRLIGVNQLCAGGEKGRDACQGDSGGALMRIYEDKLSQQQNQWYQEGVVAYGKGCGTSGYPAIYTRVTRYMKWIVSTISNN